DSVLFFLSLAQYVFLAWQITFPLFAWSPRWRWLLLGGGVLGWLGCAFLYGEPLFGPVYFIGCLSYLTPAELPALTTRLLSPVQGLAGSATAPVVKKVGVRS